MSPTLPARDAQRLAAQLLSGARPPDPVGVAERLLAVQAQDPRGVRLAIRARTTEGLSAGAVDRALTDDRTLVVSWLNRGTLHLVRSEDHAWLHALTTPPQRTGNARRLAQEGVPPADADRAVRAIERALAEEGPLTRAQLRERVAAAGVRTDGQALVHCLMAATLPGLVVRGPMVGPEQTFVLARDWLPPSGAVERDVALAELARRYLAGHGPASERDLARWAGLPLRDARAGLAAIARELAEREDGLVDLKRRAGADVPPPPPPRLLGQFDPLLLGWTSRQPVLGDRQDVVTSNGMFRAFALVGGRGAGTWTLRGGRVELSLWGRLAQSDAAALEADADQVVRFLAGAA